MDEKTIKICRLSTVVIWVLVIVNWLIGGLPVIGGVLHWVGIILIVSHAIELLVFSGKLKNSSNKASDAIQLLIYGYFHAITMK